MMKLLGILLSVLLLFSWVEPVFALTNQASNLTKEELKQQDQLANKAFAATNKGDFAVAEEYWTEILEKFPENAAVWSNRGNSRVSQNKLEEALVDFNKSIELAPNVTDPYLNRGTALEGLGKWDEAIADYNHVLELDPDDAMAYNNRGNAEAGLKKWQEAIADYRKSAEIAPNFAFARANYVLALYEIGEEDKAIREMKNIIRKYPQFPDVRASLTAALWAKGEKGEAESNWVAAYGLDRRYKDIDWVKNVRRWPDRMVAALDKFLKLQ
ncbi:tetratricopeptide repeat protein [Rivularia sp. PCC 7116]|uniref:tetratricopeptide repeat protein n=1 Tax=Rivularia sp. PCC 7116 TaxID=373994 RepID=UPI0005C7DDC6|nr:tetratricopeptide repeat protein [Rivularia sp. PCC 7116]